MDDKKKEKILRLIVAFVVIIYAMFNTNILGSITSGVTGAKKAISSSKTKSVSKVDGNLSVYFIDVGQGDAILIKTAKENMLIDAGPLASSTKLTDYLKSLNISELNVVVVTHPHEDHIGGMTSIINNFKIDKFYMPDAITTTATFEGMLDALDKNNIKYTVPKIGDSFSLSEAKFDVLHVGTGENDLNASSIVLKMTYGENKFLFMGDAPVSVEEKILNDDLKSDVLKVGHHGSEYSSSQAFLNEVKPSYAVISVGKNNTYGHPNATTLDKLSSVDAKVFRTDLNGTILMVSDGTNINVSMIDTKTN